MREMKVKDIIKVIEEFAPLSIQEGWDLVNTSERTRKHCMMLENCCYDFYELTCLNMAQKGVFGEIVHVEGAYCHNLDPYWNKYHNDWRMTYNRDHAGDVYPTHGIGPVCQALNIHRGDKMDVLVSMQSNAFRGQKIADERYGKGVYDYANGDNTCTIIRTRKGKTILVEHVVTTPRPYNRMYQLCGTEGFANKYPNEGLALGSHSVEGIDSQNLDNLEFLTSLQKLNVLNLPGCRFDSERMAIVATLPALTELSLSNCALSTIDFLENAPSLKTLNLSNNTIRKLAVLATIPTLESINLQHNAVTALEEISTLQNLKELNIGYNSVSSLIPLASCTSMIRLNADHNMLETLEGLQGMTQLAYLSVDYNNISSIIGLTANTALTDLSIASNKINDITYLSALTNLEVLDFSGNQVEVLPQWTDGCPLQTIDGSYNVLTSVDSLSNLQSLTHVYMDYNLITDINALENCFCLVQVNVYGNAIPDVSVLRDRDIIVNYDPTLAQAAEESE